jgi:DNA (cytosine-5)-methyltransferase 1
LLPTPTAAEYGTSQNGQRADGSIFDGAGKPSLSSMARKGMFPTPTSSMGERGGRGDLIHFVKSGGVTARGTLPRKGLLPTPTASDPKRGYSDIDKERKRGDKRGVTLTAATVSRYLPTPTAHDHKDTGPSQMNRNTPMLGPTVTGGDSTLRLAPRFVEWMMGWPDGWTLIGLEPAATASCPKPQPRHGKSSSNG